MSRYNKLQFCKRFLDGVPEGSLEGISIVIPGGLPGNTPEETLQE